MCNWFESRKFFKRLNVNLVAQVSHLGDSPEINDVIGSIKNNAR